MKLKVVDAKTYYDADNKRAKVCNINPGYTCLVGPNGCGKTTLLKQIRSFCENNHDKYECMHYDNLHDGGFRAAVNCVDMNRISTAATLLRSSEGEGIIINLGTFAGKCGEAANKCSVNGKSLVILIDGFDSGTSINKIYDFRKYLVNTILESCERDGPEVYIIATANNYAMVDESVDCINAHTRKHRTFRSYNSFKKFIIDLAQSFDDEAED